MLNTLVSIKAFQRALPGRAVRWRRSFFNFSKFPSPDSLLDNEIQTQSYREQKIFPYRSGDLYKVIADVGSYPNFVPYCTSSRILERREHQDGMTVMEAELTVGFLAFKESYVSRVTCKLNKSVEAVASSSSPLFKTLTTVWRLSPASVSPASHLKGTTDDPTSRSHRDEGPTLVTLDLSFAFANPVHAAVSTTFFGQVSKLMVKAFEQRCAALYGPRTD